jgi:quinol monooxygenase YgiN
VRDERGPAIADAGVELTVMMGVFDAAAGRETDLAGVLARYVVVSRSAEGCRNIDLVASLITPGRFVVYEKWESPEAQANHMAGATMAEMAEEVSPLLSSAPDLGLFVAVSAHDLL